MYLMRILLVEDDPAVASGLSDGLRLAGFEVHHVTTGNEGAQYALGTNPPDVVLLDLGLPDRDGYDVCREIRATSSVPIIVVSARDDEIDRVVGLELGADDYLSKPFGVRELIAERVGRLGGQAQIGQVDAKGGQGLVVEVAAEVIRAVQKHFGAAHAVEQGVVLAGDGAAVLLAEQGHQGFPRGFQKGARGRCLGNGHLELLHEFVVGRRKPQPGQEAVDFGAGEFFAIVHRGKAQGAEFV